MFHKIYNSSQKYLNVITLLIFFIYFNNIYINVDIISQMISNIDDIKSFTYSIYNIKASFQ